MATLNEFLEKALVNEGELVGDKADEGSWTSASSDVFYADVKFKIKLTGVKDMNEAMKRAQRFVDDVTKKYKLFDPVGMVDGVEGS